MEERELQWDDVIERDTSEFILLPEGDYEFTVESYDKARHQGSENLPACNKAILKLRIETPEGTTYVSHNLFLHTKTERLLSAFFSSIGQKKKGEALRMNWNQVPGSTGRAKIGIYHYTNKNGEQRQSNEIKRFYPKEEGPAYKAGEF